MTRWRNIRWARLLPSRPSCIPQSRPRGIKGEGIKYEKQIASALPGAIRGQWFEFEDNSGRHYCQTDFISSISDVGLLVLEAKLTWVMEGHQKLESLYIPVVESAFQLPTWGMVIARRIVPNMDGITILSDLPAAMESVIDGNRTCLHWLGQGAIPNSAICKSLPQLELVH